MTCTGTYIDVDDVIILLNEPNNDPTPEEVTIIEDLVHSLKTKERLDCLEDILEIMMPFVNCCQYGIRVINNQNGSGQSENTAKGENMKTTEYEVEFDKYCKKCKFADTPEVNDPCNECLDQCWNEETRKPIHYISAVDEKNKGYSST